mmetsp:Transcript_19516/g.49950  ORF Transcript_19516/g.49950 Transcript_19516/m.49950 type:complete len:814 (+) Transcript_19516:64-2505(+)
MASKADAPKETAPKAEAQAPLPARPEVKSSVSTLTAEAAKPKPEAKAAPASAAAASVAKEKVKAEKPKAEAKAGTVINVIPAQTPSPSVVGASATPPTLKTDTTQVAAQGSETSYRQSPAASASVPAAQPSRTAVSQLTGAAPGGYTAQPAGLAAAASTVAKSQPEPVPRQAAEIVSRAPVPSTASMPPSTVPVSSSVPAVGFANSLTALGQQALKAMGLAAPEQPAAAATGSSAPATVPKEGPAAVAVGRAAARGSNPVVMKNAAGKLTTPISKKYQIIFVTSEVAPWSKTGGLGEAMDGLPTALAGLGHRVMTIAPRYDQYKEGWDTAYAGEVPMGNSVEPVRAFHAFESKVDRVFIDHECFLGKVWGKTGSMLYGPEWGKDFADNQWRFTYFAKAVLKIIQELPLGGFAYGGDCIVVVNDWHCGMVPVYLSMMKKACPKDWTNTKSCLLIHNAVFQGRFDRDDPEEPNTEVYGLPEAIMSTFTFNMPIKVGRTEAKVKRCINWMGCAAKYVDRILTVSPTYAWEIINLPEMGCELDDIFMAKGVTGIVNGVKETVSPMNATFTKKAEMPSTFSVKDVDEKKAELKAQLQEMYGLPVSAETPLCVFVGRMDLQKGYDYLLAALTAVLKNVDLQLIIIGTGRADLVASSKALAKKFPEKIYLAGWCGAERYAMVAGADYNLMPSRWEPCGLAQLESMRFGTLPVVAQTGGLVDTVQDMVTGIHLGGAVSVEKELDPSSVELMAQVLEKCVEVYADKEQTSKMRKAAMAAGSEFTWTNAALQYEAVFEELDAVDILPRCKDASVTLEADKVVA